MFNDVWKKVCIRSNGDNSKNHHRLFVTQINQNNTHMNVIGFESKLLTMPSSLYSIVVIVVNRFQVFSKQNWFFTRPWLKCVRISILPQIEYAHIFFYRTAVQTIKQSSYFLLFCAVRFGSVLCVRILWIDSTVAYIYDLLWVCERARYTRIWK